MTQTKERVVTSELLEKYSEEGFNVLCVWQGTTLKQKDGTSVSPEEFESVFEKQILPGCKVKFLEEIYTLPDLDPYDRPIEGTGGRADLFFLMHDDCISEFAIKRLQMGIRWYEDVVAPYNHGTHLYSSAVRERYASKE